MTGWALPGFVHVRQVRVDLVGRRVVARHRMTRRFVSITYLARDFLADAEFQHRFAAQVSQLERVRDARVARLRQFVVSGDQAAVVADHVDGTPLRVLLIEEGAIAPEAAVVVLKDALGGLVASHAEGVAHADLKPENVLLTRSGHVRLADFGLSTRAGRQSLAWSTPFYLAPEQWGGGPATPAGDLYAATATFFECLVGAPPFHADTPAALAALHEHGTPPLDAVPGPFRQLVERGLAKDQASRPSPRRFLDQVEEVANQILGVGWERRGRRELTRLLTSPSPLLNPTVLAGLSDPTDRIPRQPVRLTAALGGALVVAAGLASPELPSGGSRGGPFLREDTPAEAAPAPPLANESEEVRAGMESPAPDHAPDSPSVAMAEPAELVLASSAAQPGTMAASAPSSSPAPSQSVSAPESVPATQPEIPAQTSSPPAGSAPASEQPVPRAETMSGPPTHTGTVPGSQHPAQCAEETETGAEHAPTVELPETGFPWPSEEPWNEESLELTPSIPEWPTGYEEHDGSPFGDGGW